MNKMSFRWMKNSPLGLVQFSGAIYALNRPTRTERTRRVSIRPLSQRQALVELTKSTFNCTITDPDRLQNQFSFATHIAPRVPVRRLSYPRRLELLPSVREAIVSDLAALQSTVLPFDRNLRILSTKLLAALAQVSYGIAPATASTKRMKPS